MRRWRDYLREAEVAAELRAGGATVAQIAEALGVSRVEAYRMLRLAELPTEFHQYVGRGLPASAAWHVAMMGWHERMDVLKRLQSGERVSVRLLLAHRGLGLDEVPRDLRTEAAPERPDESPVEEAARAPDGPGANYYHVTLDARQAEDLLVDLSEAPETPVGQRLRLSIASWLQNQAKGG